MIHLRVAALPRRSFGLLRTTAPQARRVQAILGGRWNSTVQNAETDVVAIGRWNAVMHAAEERTSPEAMYRAGMACLRGEHGAPLDANAAKTWLREAAEMGHGAAQAMLGRIIVDEMEALREQAHAHDYQAAAEAERWLKQASDQGETDAARALIPLYLTRGDLGAACCALMALVLSSGRSWLGKATRE